MATSTLRINEDLDELNEDDIHLIDINAGADIHENVPVYEGDDLLRDLVKRKFNLSHSKADLYFWRSAYSKDCVVVAQNKNTALDWLADLGILDGLKISEEEEERQLKERGMVEGIRLGNAGEPFDLRNYRLDQFELSDITNFKNQIEFHEHGLMHIWENNSFNDKPPFTDVFVQLSDFTRSDKIISVQEYWGPNDFSTPNRSYMKSKVLDEIWTAVQEKF